MTCISGIVCWGDTLPPPSVARRMAQVGQTGGIAGPSRTLASRSAILQQASRGDGSSRLQGAAHHSQMQPSVHVVADARIDELDGASRPVEGGGLDVPTLLARAYEKWGRGLAPRLIGDYAVAIWDPENRRFFAARDPLGMRPLYYTFNGKRLLFASRVEQLVAAGIEPAPFEPAVAAHLAGPVGRLDWTFLQGVLQLPPGKVLIGDEDGLRLKEGSSVMPRQEIRYARDSEYEEHFRRLLLQAVEDRVASTGRTGFLLSGGCDSGAMASAAGWLKEKGTVRSQLISYSFSFERFPDCDERSTSRPIVERYGFWPRDVPGDDGWPLSGLPEYGPDLVDPFISPHLPLLARGAELAGADGVSVMMMGNRGDELVGDGITDLPGMLRSLRLVALLKEVHELAQGRPRRWMRVLRRNLVRPLRAERSRNVRPGGGASFRVPPWVREDFARRVDLEDIIEASVPEPTFRDVARETRHRRITMFAGHRITAGWERIHARHGISFVDPWSDVRLARFIQGVPQHLVNRATERKRIVRRGMRGIYPEPALSRAAKVIPASLYDFGIKRAARDIIEDLLTESQAEARGFMDASAVREEWETYARTGSCSFDIWWPLTLELWLRSHWK